MASLFVLRAALQGVRARPWRSALTGVSIVVATVSILVATVGSQLFGDYQRQSFDLNGGLVATVEVAIDPDQLLEQSPEGAIARVQHLAPPGAAVDIVYQSGGVTIESGGSPVAAGMSLIAGSGVVTRDVTSGRWLRTADAMDAVPALVLNRAADDALGHPLFDPLLVGREHPRTGLSSCRRDRRCGLAGRVCRPRRPETADTRGTRAAGGQLGGPQGAWRGT